MTVLTIVDFLRDNDIAIRITLAAIFIIALLILIFISRKIEKPHGTNSGKIKKMAAISILSAISVVLYYFVKISVSVVLPFIPSFLELHFSNLPIYIGGFLFGPISGAIITTIRFIAKLPGSTTMGVGELSDFVIGLATVLVASMMYHRHKSKKTAKFTLMLVVLIWTFVAVISNWLFILPFYIQLYGFNAILGMLSVIPGITADNYMLYYLLIAIVPFNLIIATINVFITYFVYKRVSVLYDVIHIDTHKK